MALALPQEDLERVLEQTRGLWTERGGVRILFTGASGFFGSWMLESFLFAGTQLDLPFRAVAVTRNAEYFSRRLPHLAGDPRVEVLEADAATLPLPAGPVDYLIHSLFAPAALPEMERQFGRATKRLLEIAAQKSVRGCLLCSTGAVYKPPLKLLPIPEASLRFGAGDPLSYPGIRAQVEDQWLAESSRYGLSASIARGFAFMGPRLPLDGQFAVGNFLRDVLAGEPVTVQGDGAPVRSYLHAADLTVRLWHLLVSGQASGVYNVGSEHALTIAEVARAVAGLTNPAADVRILGKDSPFSYYVPDTARIGRAFPLPPPLSFCKALQRTWNWLDPRLKKLAPNLN